jgi:soluble lytic murein transglycosylase-like protein
MRSARAAAALAVALAPAALAPAALAEVKVDVRDDGIKVIRGEPNEARSRRLAARLVPIPTAKMAVLLDRWAGERGLDFRLVQAVVQVESGYNPRALSTKGAIGLMQLMPGTARELGIADPWSPDQNVAGGTEYLRRMMETFDGDLELALAAYNAGPNAVLEHAGIPPYAETRAYVRKVLCLYEGSCGEAGDAERRGPEIRIGRDAEGRIVLSGGRDG